jgi:hypothetical protein
MSFFYHGTTELIGKIDFAKCRSRTDFGKGFSLNKIMLVQYNKRGHAVFHMALCRRKHSHLYV